MNMENENLNQIIEDTPKTEPAKKDYLLPASIFVSTIVLAAAWIYAAGLESQKNQGKTNQPQTETGRDALEQITLPVRWGDLGRKMIEAGVYDKERLFALYAGRGGVSAEDAKLVDGIVVGELKVNEKNAGLLLNLLWALGLSNKNEILENGPMTDSRYGGAERFASTGGWTLAKGGAMSHYSKHAFATLTAAQQALVERVSKNIYRPCCDNATYFPDCNHGMAMLGLLELMASQGATEAQMYKAALALNSYWFPEQYGTIARYLESKGIPPQSAVPKEILGAAYSSGSGFRRIASMTPPEPESDKRQNGGCGV